MNLSTSDFDYKLPQSLIAERPLANRAASRMMVLNRAEQSISHRHFAEFPQFVREGDLVVLNDTKVIPARVFSDDGRMELLFLEQLRPQLWRCMVKPGRRLRVGVTVRVGGVQGQVIEVTPAGERLISFSAPVPLDEIGKIPLPPYIRRESDARDVEQYQTVYARAPGAVAAPTAGLHFTPEILRQIPHVFLTLHVGAGTFRPVQVENIAEHQMHPEKFVITPEAADAINAAQRPIAVGTTTVRVLETCARRDGVTAGEGETDIFIYPPFEFQLVDVLLTNFHLPRSTLLMLVSAFAGREFVLRAYAEAIRKKYRFYSYGDCMLIV